MIEPSLSSGEKEEKQKVIEDTIDWHALLVKDFEYSDPSDDDITSGEECESEDESVSYLPPAISNIDNKLI